MDPAADERRRSPRRPIRVEVKAGIASAEGEMVFETLDMSTTGAFLISDLLLDPGERMTVVIPDGDRRDIAIDAVVVRVSLPEHGGHSLSGMGIEFSRMAKELFSLVDRLSTEAVS
jgi:hypothetical protein